MRILIIHEEARAIAGAERMLLYFLDGAKESPGLNVIVAAVRESPFGKVLPKEVKTIWLPGGKNFSLKTLLEQVRVLTRAHHAQPFHLAHGWAARSWELTALFSKRTGVPAMGTLHDHPAARFHSRFRRWLMRFCARRSLGKIACVSEAVRAACLQQEYPRDKVEVVHNGLPLVEPLIRKISNGHAFRLGFLGVLSERKGVRELFMMLDGLAQLSSVPWEMFIAGGTQDSAGEALVERVRQDYGNRSWWDRVRWCGWSDDPKEFLRSIDLLIVPSSEFDPFPTVLLEAGQQALPVLATSVGGIPEIVIDGETGWLFEPAKPMTGAQRLAELLAAPNRCLVAGQTAARRLCEVFSVGKMVAGYRQLYSTLSPDE